jgi:hypothetical protein
MHSIKKYSRKRRVRKGRKSIRPRKSLRGGMFSRRTKVAPLSPKFEYLGTPLEESLPSYNEASKLSNMFPEPVKYSKDTGWGCHYNLVLDPTKCNIQKYSTAKVGDGDNKLVKSVINKIKDIVLNKWKIIKTHEDITPNGYFIYEDIFISLSKNIYQLTHQTNMPYIDETSDINIVLNTIYNNFYKPPSQHFHAPTHLMDIEYIKPSMVQPKFFIYSDNFRDSTGKLYRIYVKYKVSTSGEVYLTKIIIEYTDPEKEGLPLTD